MFLREVRRTVIMNVPLNSRTIPAILGRTRDVDQSIRKLVFGQILAKNVLEQEQGENVPPSIGPTHPRNLTVPQREMIIKNGLGDRDITVRKATELLVSTWMETVDMKIEESDVKLEEQKEMPENRPIALLQLFDLNLDLSVPSMALMSIFATRADIFNETEFPSTNFHLFFFAML
jgi:condensin complex subunit 3